MAPVIAVPRVARKQHLRYYQSEVQLWSVFQSPNRRVSASFRRRSRFDTWKPWSEGVIAMSDRYEVGGVLEDSRVIRLNEPLPYKEGAGKSCH